MTLISAVFPDLMDRKKCDIMKWTQTNSKSQEEFLCQSKKEQCHLVMTKHSRVAQSKWLLNKAAHQKKLPPSLVFALKPSNHGSSFQPGATDRQNRNDKRQRELEAEIRSLRKQLAEKDEVIDVLKKSVGIFSKL